MSTNSSSSRSEGLPPRTPSQVDPSGQIQDTQTHKKSKPLPHKPGMGEDKQPKPEDVEKSEHGE
jgi:hypothetical protein